MIVCYILAREEPLEFMALDNRGAMASGYPYATDRIASAKLFTNADEALSFKRTCDRLAPSHPNLRLKDFEIRTLRLGPRNIQTF